MNDSSKSKKKIWTRFFLTAILYTAAILGVRYLLWSGDSESNSGWIICGIFLLYGYYQAIRWLRDRLGKASGGVAD